LNPRSTADIIKQLEREEQEEKKLCGATTSANVSLDLPANSALKPSVQI